MKVNEMEFQFNLPENNKDLLNSSGDSYYVKHLYTPDEIPEKLRICKQVLGKNDPFYIFDHFDTYYAVLEIKGSDSVAMNNLMRSFDLLYITVDKLGDGLAEFLTKNGIENSQKRISYLNLTKMCLFLLVNVVRKMDANLVSLQQQQQLNQQRKRNKTGDCFKQFADWERKRGKFMVQLYNIMQLSLEKLWSPPMAEENFINLLCDSCYRILELLHLRAETRHDIETIFQIFGTAIKRYQHAINFPVKILQVLRSVEHAGATLAHGIRLLHEEYNISSIFSILVKEITDSLAMDSSDIAVSRNYSNFLMELASITPKLIIPHMSTLSDELLNCESHVLRNCILQIMGDAILGELTSENLPEDMKEARNEFLENLLMHINDVSAHVRVKVLQIWNHLTEEQAVPLCFQLKVLSGAVERLEDKTSSVRKHAVELIKAFLERNPFSAKLTFDDLRMKHAEEVLKMEKLSQLLEREREKAKNLEEQWVEIMSSIMPFVEEIIKNVDTPTPAETNETYEDLVQRISSLLLEKKFKEAVQLVHKADHMAGNSEIRLSLQHEEQCAYFMALLKSYVFLANGCKDSNEELGTQIKTVQFLQDSMEFSKMISKAMPKMQEMLSSKTNSDVFEAVDLFTTGYLFGIKGTEAGMRQMLLLVWSSDKEKRDAVSDAYKRVLFTTDQIGRAHALRVVQNLSKFLQSLEYGHYTALECLIHEWVAKGDIDGVIIQVLFELFTMKLEGTNELESRLALQLLIMCSSAKSTIASANLNIIENIGFGLRGKTDPRIFRGCLDFLLNSVVYTNLKFHHRYEATAGIVEKITDIYLKMFFHPDVPDFDRITMKTLQFYYQLCQTPDVICDNIIKQLLLKFKACIQELHESHGNDEHTESLQSNDVVGSQIIPNTWQQQDSGGEGSYDLPVFLLTRFIFMVGYLILKEMIFLDIDVYNNMRYCQELRECEQKRKKKKRSNPKIINCRRTLTLNMSATESLKRLSVAAAEPQQEPDEELVGATAEDNIAEWINHLCENILIFDDNSLLSVIFAYIVKICKYPGRYKDEHLQQAATLALIRFMCSSSRLCGQNLPFLMNILQHTDNISIKCNIVIGLSDLIFRFPNIIEPWTGNLYAMLHASNTELRLTTVKMLSHLILHEMIRVKGQIADLAMCIVDEDDEIKNITRQFFKEIANKSNILYNVLPDIISKLSDCKLNLEEEKYHIIMRYILGLIQKDRQVETLVEKLCLRFTVTREERQWRDIAYCLSLLSYNEKTIKKLIDNIQYYKDKLQIDEVHESFKLIISNTSKLAKAELKAVITELESRINACLTVNNEPNTNEPTLTSKEKKKARKKSTANAKRHHQRERQLSTSVSENPDVTYGLRRSVRNLSLQKRITFSSSSDEDDSDFAESDTKKKKKCPRPIQHQAVAEESPGSEDDTQRTRRRSGRK